MDLTPKQIDFWRTFLVIHGCGPYALIAPASDIQRIAENMQKLFNSELDEKPKEKKKIDEPKYIGLGNPMMEAFERAKEKNP